MRTQFCYDIKDQNVFAVIGANYGDEGKGATVRQLVENLKANVSTNNPIVVRASGGANCGHTVVHNGKRHVFKHFGSGTLQGCPTYLGSEFIINPLLFVREWEELARLGITPQVFVSPFCRFTTHYDMMLNQFSELMSGRQASTGVGIFETVNRYNMGLEQDCEYHRLGKVEDFGINRVLSFDFERMVERYVKIRKQEIIPVTQTEKQNEIVKQYLEYLSDKEFENRYKKVFEKMLSLIKLDRPTANWSVLYNFNTVIFEGNQGLGLDKNSNEFPYNTPCDTGASGPIEYMCDQMKYDTINIIYVTRPYFTRHGASKGQWENSEYIHQFFTINDKTNIPNEWQGSIKYRLFNRQEFHERVNKDFDKFSGCKNKVRSIALTCLDQKKDWVELDKVLEAAVCVTEG